MKQLWQRVAARIDELTLRQRAILFAMISLIVVVLANVILIEPLLIRQKRLLDAANRDQSQLRSVRAQIESVLKDEQGDAKDPEQVALRELESRVAQAEKELARRKDAFVAPTRLPTLLKDLLGAGRSVRLEALKVLPGAPLEGGPQLYRHGVELTLTGGYFELLQFLGELEKLPARLLWGPVELQAEKYPEIRLTVQVGTLSPERSLGL